MILFTFLTDRTYLQMNYQTQPIVIQNSDKIKSDIS